MKVVATIVWVLGSPAMFKLHLILTGVITMNVAAQVFLSQCMRVQAFNALRGSSLEKYVKRVGQLAAAEDRASSELTAAQVGLNC